MKNFKTILSNLTKACDQIYGAVIMGFDGVTLSKYFMKDLPLSPDVFEAFIAEFSPLVMQFYKKSQDIDLGQTQKITAEMGEVNFVFKILNKDSFLAVVTHKDAFLGKVDYYARIEAQRFQNTFNV